MVKIQRFNFLCSAATLQNEILDFSCKKNSKLSKVFNSWLIVVCMVKGEFFDISRLPKSEGILVFPISMSRIITPGQNAKSCMKYIYHFHPLKTSSSSRHAKTGANFIYGDSLYLYSKEKAYVLKNNFMNSIKNHADSIMNLVKKDKYLIKDAFSFTSWSQIYLDCESFLKRFDKLKKIYKKDKLFQKYVKEDFKGLNNPRRKLDENQINFFLEEHLMLYLIAKGEVRLRNDFIRGHERWILNCYPGPAMKAHMYLHQKNFFHLDNPENPYQDAWYDLEKKKLYRFDEINLEEY